MRNPFRSEAEAYRLVFVLAGFFGAIVIANELLGRWAGLVAFVLASAAVVWWLFKTGPAEAPTQVAPRPRDDGVRRVLVIANETVAGGALRERMLERAGEGRAEVLVVCPALNSPLRHWASDEDDARRAAEERLERSLARLREAGVDARGEVGDGEPLQAIEDALRTFGADEIVISTHPEGRSHWLERGVVDGARRRFAVPIHHVVVDLHREAPPRGY